MSSEDKDNKKNKVIPKDKTEKPKKEIGGQEGPEPTRYGEIGRASCRERV